MTDAIRPDGIPDTLWDDWRQTPKDWYHLYRWSAAARDAHTEPAAALITHAFDSISLKTDGLRQQPFRLSDHRGQLRSEPAQVAVVNERRIVRALFNAKRLPLLGRMLDYEVPLKEVRDADHGDVDLISVSRGDCLCVEAKKPGSDESLLRPLLQAYTYSRLLWLHRRRFLDEYDLDSQTRLTPAVLTFDETRSVDQLYSLDKLPRLEALLRLLDRELEACGLGAIRFFVVGADSVAIKESLTMSPTEETDVYRPSFGESFPFVVTEVGVSAYS